MKSVNLKIVAFCLIFMISFIHDSYSSKVIGCYYGSWSGYRNGDGKFEPENIDATLCTHLFYSFVGITANGGVRILDEWNDLPSGKDFFGRFNALRKQNPNAKTIVAIGGWNEGSLTYSQVANDPNLRSAFARNAADFVQQYGFDGFDLDWEYPADRGGAASDYEAYALLIKEMRSVFDERGGLLLTAAIGINEKYVTTSYNVPEMSKYLDLINMMTYDFHGSWEETTGHHAPLYRSKVDTDFSLNVNASIHNWLKNGAIAGKLVLGVGTYGRSFTLRNPSNNAIGAPSSGPGTGGPLTQESGSFGYNEICSNVNAGWTVKWDDDILAPFAYSGNQWVGYDNVRSTKIKAQYAKDMGLAGAFIWSLETDDFLGRCNEGKFPILKALNEVLLSDGSSGGDSSSPSSSVSTSSTTTTTSPSPPSPSSTTSGSGQLCTSVGYFAHPSNCQVFFHCQSDGNGGFITHQLLCADNLAFDPLINTCNHRDQVSGCN